MKKLSIWLAAALLLLTVSGCERMPPATTEADEPQTTAEPVTQAPTEAPTEMPTEDSLVMPDDVPTDENGKPYYLFGHYLERMKTGVDDPYYYGDAVLRRLVTGETTLSFSGRYLHYSNDMLDWANARTDGEGLFEDANLELTLTGTGTDEYILLHDGKDANYVYLSAQEKYVPIVNGSDRYIDFGNRPSWIDATECPPDRTTEDICEDISRILHDQWDRWLATEPNYRLHAASPEEAAQQYCEHLERHLMQIQESLLGKHWRFDYVRVDNLTDVTYDEGTKTLTFFYDLTKMPSNPESDVRAGGWIVDNEDGSYTQTLDGYLVLNEDGEWQVPMNDGYWK